MSNRHLQFRFILGTIAEWGIVAFLAYKLLCLIGTVLEWLCDNIIGTITAVGIGIMLLALVGVLIVMYTPKEEGEDDVE